MDCQAGRTGPYPAPHCARRRGEADRGHLVAVRQGPEDRARRGRPASEDRHHDRRRERQRPQERAACVIAAARRRRTDPGVRYQPDPGPEPPARRPRLPDQARDTHLVATVRGAAYGRLPFKTAVSNRHDQDEKGAHWSLPAVGARVLSTATCSGCHHASRQSSSVQAMAYAITTNRRFLGSPTLAVG